jgi:hypothetical protein
MKIQSRPAVKQNCEPIVESALQQMIGGTRVISLDEHERTLNLIMSSLKMSGVLSHYEIGATRETAASTYEKTEYMIRIKFTDDPTKKTGYVADLIFHYTH